MPGELRDPYLPECSTWNILSGYYCTYNTIRTVTAYETTETGYSAAASATEDFPAAGFGGGGGRSADAIAGAAAILQGDQEADYVVSGCGRSGVVQKSWTGVPDADQSGAMEGDEGREEDIGGMKLDCSVRASRRAREVAQPQLFLSMLNAEARYTFALKWPISLSFQ